MLTAVARMNLFVADVRVCERARAFFFLLVLLEVHIVAYERINMLISFGNRARAFANDR